MREPKRVGRNVFKDVIDDQDWWPGDYMYDQLGPLVYLQSTGLIDTLKPNDCPGCKWRLCWRLCE